MSVALTTTHENGIFGEVSGRFLRQIDGMKRGLGVLRITSGRAVVGDNGSVLGTMLTKALINQY